MAEERSSSASGKINPEDFVTFLAILRDAINPAFYHFMRYVMLLQEHRFKVWVVPLHQPLGRRLVRMIDVGVPRNI